MCSGCRGTIPPGEDIFVAEVSGKRAAGLGIQACTTLHGRRLPRPIKARDNICTAEPICFAFSTRFHNRLTPVTNSQAGRTCWVQARASPKGGKICSAVELASTWTHEPKLVARNWVLGMLLRLLCQLLLAMQLVDSSFSTRFQPSPAVLLKLRRKLPPHLWAGYRPRPQTARQGIVTKRKLDSRCPESGSIQSHARLRD